jgi:hypothetical protein
MSGKRQRIIRKQRAHLHSAVSGRFVSPVGADPASTVAVSERVAEDAARELELLYAAKNLLAWGASRESVERLQKAIDAYPAPGPGLDVATVVLEAPDVPAVMDKTSGEVE